MTMNPLPLNPVLPPDRRPRCNWCGKKLQPARHYEWKKVEDESGFKTVRVDTGLCYGYGYTGGGTANAGMFCSLRCGFTYACHVTRKERE